MTYHFFAIRLATDPDGAERGDELLNDDVGQRDERREEDAGR